MYLMKYILNLFFQKVDQANLLGIKNSISCLKDKSEI